MANKKIKFPLWLMPDTKATVERLYRQDGCSSQSEFIEKAILFYCGYLQSEYAGDFLPKILGETLEATPEIEQQVTNLLGRLAEQPERITQPETANSPQHSTTQADLDSILNTQPLDEEAARSLIFRLAQEQYDAIGDAEYETERLRRLFATFECTAELNAELLQSVVSAVLVTHQTVRLHLKNGQIIGKDDLV